MIDVFALIDTDVRSPFASASYPSLAEGYCHPPISQKRLSRSLIDTDVRSPFASASYPSLAEGYCHPPISQKRL